VLRVGREQSNSISLYCLPARLQAVTSCTYFATSAKYPGLQVYALAGGFASWTAAGYETAPTIG
jgi:hypothetical protein